MKNIILSLSVLALMISCNKKENTNNSVSEENTEKTTTTTVQLTEMNAEQVSNILAPKKNDTIYVTNFFATWCGPCMREMPYFKEKMEEMKSEKIKFTFVNIDNPKDWTTKVNDFAAQSGLAKNIVLFNYETMPQDFFAKNFQSWDGSAIPFTLITKGDKRDEHMGMMFKEDLAQKINSFK